MTFKKRTKSGSSRRTAVAWLATAMAFDSAALADLKPAGDMVDPKVFGAMGDGLADDTAALAAAFDFGISSGRPIRLSGKYRISGPLQPYKDARPAGALHIWCAVDSYFVVDRDAKAFGDVLYFHTKSACDCSILGAKLSIDGAHRVGRGITIRHNAELGGSVRITAGLNLSHFYERAEHEVRENQALAVIGSFLKVDIAQVVVDSVRRTNSAGANKGIAVAGFVGAVSISDCTVKDVRVPSIGSADADGVAVFSKAAGNFYESRKGSSVVSRCTFIDCQGRSVKSQCSNTTVIDPIVRRQQAVSIPQSVEFDFQLGNGVVTNPKYFYYRGGDGRSPLGSSHSCIAFQQLLTDQPMRAITTGGKLRTEVLVPRYVAAIYRSWSAASEIRVEGLRVVAEASTGGGAIHRAVIELNVSELASGKSKAHIVAARIEGSIQRPMVGYHSFAGQDVSGQLFVEVHECIGDSPTRPPKLFANVSGQKIACLPNLRTRANIGFADSELGCS